MRPRWWAVALPVAALLVTLWSEVVRVHPTAVDGEVRAEYSPRVDSPAAALPGESTESPAPRFVSSRDDSVALPSLVVSREFIEYVRTATPSGGGEEEAACVRRADDPAASALARLLPDCDASDAAASVPPMQLPDEGWRPRLSALPDAQSFPELRYALSGRVTAVADDLHEVSQPPPRSTLRRTHPHSCHLH
jgi:hypothetical protein